MAAFTLSDVEMVVPKCLGGRLHRQPFWQPTVTTACLRTQRVTVDALGDPAPDSGDTWL
jgi:hypothetical protein